MAQTESEDTIRKDIKRLRTSQLFDKKLQYYIFVSVAIGLIFSLILIACQAVDYKSEEHVYNTSELFDTTAQTNRYVYDVAVVFSGQDNMKSLQDNYGQSKLGVYVLSTSEDRSVISEYTYEDLSDRVKSKPASIICVYQTTARDWFVFYPKSLWDAIPEPAGYFDHVYSLLQKMDLANTYANIVNYTYELYPDLNELVAVQVNKVVEKEARNEFIKTQVFYVISLTLLAVLIGLVLDIILKDFKESSEERLKEHINKQIESDTVKNTEKVDMNIEKFQLNKAEPVVINPNNSSLPDWVRYVGLTSKLSDRMIDIQSNIDRKEISNNTESLVQKLQSLERQVREQFGGGSDDTPKVVRKFYRTYFPMLMSLASEMDKIVKDDDFQKVLSYNEGLELYDSIVENILRQIKIPRLDTIKVSIDTVRRGAIMDGLVNDKDIQIRDTSDKADEFADSQQEVKNVEDFVDTLDDNNNDLNTDTNETADDAESTNDGMRYADSQSEISSDDSLSAGEVQEIWQEVEDDTEKQGNESD